MAMFAIRKLQSLPSTSRCLILLQSTRSQHSNNINASSDAQQLSSSDANGDEEEVWHQPWKHALGEQPPSTSSTGYVESSTEWKFVERLFPIDIIPDLPKHESYPTSSGWRPPRDPAPDLPYYVRRETDHTLPIFLECRRDQLNVETMEYDYVELVKVRNVEGDVFACEKDLSSFLQKRLNRRVGTHVNELQGLIRVNGVDKTDVEAFLFDTGF